MKAINYSRIDTEFYKKQYIKLENQIKLFRNTSLNNLSTITDGEHGSPQLDKSSGIMYLSGNNIKENYLDLSNVRFCTKELHQKNLRSSVAVGNVLMSIVGTIGKATIINEKILANTDRNVATIKDIRNINPYFLSVFLNSKFGRFQTERMSTGNVQPLLNLLQVKSIVIPFLDQKIQNLIENNFINSINKMKLSQQKYSQAENLLLSELGLENFNPSNEKISIKNLKESFLKTGRLDSEYYQPKYDDYLKKVFNYSNGYELLEECCNVKDINFIPKDKESYRYIELSNVQVNSEISDCEILLGKELPTRARRKVETGDVIVSSIEGSLESCALITDEYNNSLCSTGFYVIDSNKLNSETLLIVFKSSLMFNLMKQCCSGTILTNISKDEFLKLPIPIVKKETQGEIASYVKQSMEYSKKAKDLLKVSTKAVEIAIDKNEEIARTFLENSGGGE